MATIPQVIDYGGRPSLRSRRVDIPGQGELAVSEAVERAANTFGQVMIERKETEDRFNYNMAKQKIITAEILRREEVKETDDYETYDERYRTGLAKDRDRISEEHPMSPHDAAIWGAEVDYIRERGAAAVAEYGRTVMIDRKHADLLKSLDEARNLIVSMEPGTRNDSMLTASQQIDAAVNDPDEGWLDAVDGEDIRKKFVRSAAMGSLIQMEKEDAIAAIDKSLAARSVTDRRGITPEDIAAGKGTDSIADFLHEDDLVELREKLDKENKTERNRRVAYESLDEAFDLYKGVGKSKERMDYLMDKLKDDPEAREIGERLMRLRNADEKTVHNDRVNEDIREQGELMRQSPGTYTYDSVPEDISSLWSPPQDALMREYSESIANGEQFGKFDRWHEAEYDENGALVRGSYKLWSSLTPEQKADPTLDLHSPQWKMAFTEPVWKALKVEQDALRAGKVPQVDGPSDIALLESIAVGQGWFDRTGRSKTQDEAYQRLKFRFLDDVEAVRQSEYGGGRVPYERRKQILLQIMGEQAWQRDVGFMGFWAGWDQPIDEPTSLFAMTPKEAKSGFIHIEKVREAKHKEYIGEPEGENGEYLPHQIIEITWEQKLKNMAASELKGGRKPTEKDIENAYYAVAAGMSHQEILRRLAGKGDY